MKKTLLYPVSRSSLPIVKYWEEFFPQTDIVLSTFSGSGLVGRFIGYAAGYSEPQIMVCGDDDIEQLICQTDSFVALPFDKSTNLPEVLEKIKRIKSCYNPKKIIDFTDLEWEIPLFNPVPHPENVIFQPVLTPVVYVCGLSVNCEACTETFLAALIGLKRENFRISAFSDLPTLQLFGCHLLPSEKQMRLISAEQNIKALNKYFCDIWDEDKSDILLIHISSEIAPYNELVTGNFGMSTVELAQAASPDFQILCLPQNLIENEVIESISNELNRRYQKSIDCVIEENTVVDTLGSFSSASLKKITLSHSKRPDRQARKIAGTNIYNIQSPNLSFLLSKDIQTRFCIDV